MNCLTIPLSGNGTLVCSGILYEKILLEVRKICFLNDVIANPIQIVEKHKNMKKNIENWLHSE